MRNLILLSAGKKHVSSSSSSSSTTIGKNHSESSVAKVENSEENSFQLTKLPQAEKEQEKTRKTLDQKTLIKTLVEQRNQKRVCEPSKGNQKIRNYKCILSLLILYISRHFIHRCQFQRLD